MVLTDTGLAKVFQRIKSFVLAQLNSKASAIHTHTKSEITDFPTNYVTTDTTQTISGEKTFTSVPSVKKDSAGDLLYLIDDTINTSNEDENGLPLTGHTNSLKIRGHDGNMLPCMLTAQVFTNGDTSAELRAYKYKDISSPNSRAILSLRYIYNSNYGIATFSNVSFITPNVTNTTNLGSSALQWNSTYTRHIRIDNDINIWSSTINKTSTSGNLAIRSGPYYADGASINLKGKDQTDASGGRAYITANDGTNRTELVIYPTGETKLTIDGTTKNLAMQEDVNTLLNGKANSSHTHTSSDITDFPTIPSKTSDLTNDSGFLTGVSWNDVSNKPTLASVATSGSYNDLSNKPTIPTYSAGTNLSLNDTTFNVSNTPSFTNITIGGYTITIE
jgi:hypothetical protein